MKAIGNSAVCPKCGGGHKSKPYCLYENGWYCFSCGYTKASDRSFVPARNIHIDNPSLPPCTNNPSGFSVFAKKWLAQYYITEAHIRQYIYYCEDDSLIYPVIEDGVVTMYQRRWINTSGRKITTQGAKLPTLIENNNSDLVVLCEDYISAIRLADQYNVVCLWGTKTSYDYIRELYKKYNKCLVWLDNDESKETNSGQESAKIICNMCESVLQYRNRRRFTHNQTVTNIVTDKDPKCYSNTEIRSIIDDTSKQSRHTRGA